MNTFRVFRSLFLTAIAVPALFGAFVLILVLKMAEGLFVTLDIAKTILRQCWRPDARL